MNSIETVIIGAGPYGISVAAHLKAANHPFRIFGTPLESWRNYMPEGMYLRSEPFASNLWDPKRRYTFRRYVETVMKEPYQDFGKPVALDTFLNYADWFRAQAVGEISDIRVTRVSQTDGAFKGFKVELANGEVLMCRNVVLATGHMAHRSIPDELSGLSEKHLMHTARLRDVKKFSGQDVIVIGAGQSALESAALLHEAGAKVRILVRKCSVKWNPPSAKMGRSLIDRLKHPQAGLGGGWAPLALSELPRTFRWMYSAEKRHRFVKTAWGPSGSRWLRDRVENKIEILTKHEVKEAQEKDGRVHLKIQTEDGIKEITTDHVITGTGFKIDLTRVSCLDPALCQNIKREGDTAPAISSRFETSIPGLFIVGMPTAPTFGPVMRFMFGAKHVAPVIARHLWLKKLLNMQSLPKTPMLENQS
jgi:FAD-dependent urate hydroxylase